MDNAILSYTHSPETRILRKLLDSLRAWLPGWRYPLFGLKVDISAFLALRLQPDLDQPADTERWSWQSQNAGFAAGFCATPS
jgi:hypothetical protein